MDKSTHYCTRCDETKSVSEFGKNPRSPSGLKSWCRPCTNEYVREWRARNPESNQRQRDASAQWKKDNPEKALSHKRVYRAKHREEINERRKRPELRAAEYATRRRYMEDPSRRAAAVKAAAEWAALNPERYRATQRRADARRRARKRDVHAIRFTQEQLASRMGVFGNKCWMCGGAFEHIDHVKPLSLKGPHILANLRPACAACNGSKSGKWYGVSKLHLFIK